MQTNSARNQRLHALATESETQVKLFKWLTTLKVYVVVVEDHGIDQGERLISIHFTQRGAINKAQEESKKRWMVIDGDADKWLVKWMIAERTVSL